MGYRNFFASVLARNQRGFARAVKRSGVPRDELFICGSVLSNQAQGFKPAKQLSARGCEQNLEAFAVGGIDYLDMISNTCSGIVPIPAPSPLEHVPPHWTVGFGSRRIVLDYPGPDAESIRGQWAALEEMREAGTTRTLAVSNFSPPQLDVILSDKRATAPAVNQLPYTRRGAERS